MQFKQAIQATTVQAMDCNQMQHKNASVSKHIQAHTNDANSNANTIQLLQANAMQQQMQCISSSTYKCKYIAM